MSGAKGDHESGWSKGRGHRNDLPLELAAHLDDALEDALSHPVRRQLLRVLAEQEPEPLSPSQLVRTGGLDSTVSVVAYHAKVLCRSGAAYLADERWTTGSTQSFYRSLVATDPNVTEVLTAMASIDQECC